MGGGGGGEGLNYLRAHTVYPLTVQTRPPRDQKLATQSRVSGRCN